MSLQIHSAPGAKHFRTDCHKASKHRVCNAGSLQTLTSADAAHILGVQNDRVPHCLACRPLPCVALPCARSKRPPVGQSHRLDNPVPGSKSEVTGAHWILTPCGHTRCTLCVRRNNLGRSVQDCTHHDMCQRGWGSTTDVRLHRSISGMICGIPPCNDLASKS